MRIGVNAQEVEPLPPVQIPQERVVCFEIKAVSLITLVEESISKLRQSGDPSLHVSEICCVTLELRRRVPILICDCLPVCQKTSDFAEYARPESDVIANLRRRPFLGVRPPGGLPIGERVKGGCQPGAGLTHRQLQLAVAQAVHWPQQTGAPFRIFSFSGHRTLPPTPVLRLHTDSI